MKNCVPSCICLQYAGNSTKYRNCKAKDVKSCADILTSELSNMLPWSPNNNLAFKATKMKAMLFTISQMEKFHGFGQVVVELECKDKTLENVYEFKLLQITTDKNLNWKKHKQYNKELIHTTTSTQAASRISYFIKTRLLQ